MKTQELKRYNVWETDGNCNPIERSDKIFSGRSKRAVLKHLAYVNCDKTYQHHSMCVNLPGGHKLFVQKIG
jgi:hypothetical protein